MSLSALLCASVIAAIDVGGTSTCPTPDEVSARIREFSPQTLDSGPELSATLTQDENGVRIELRDAEGLLIAQKLLAGTGECSHVAEAASILLITWAHDAQSAVEQAAPPPATSVPPGTPQEPTRPQRVSLIHFDAETAVLAALTSEPITVGAMISGSATPTGRRFGGSVGLWALGAHPSTVRAGTWERFALSAGPLYRTNFGKFHLDAQVDAMVALLSLLPEAPPSASVVDFDAGGSAGVRLITEYGLWGGVRANGWPFTHRFPGGEIIPKWDVVLFLGIAWWA